MGFPERLKSNSILNGFCFWQNYCVKILTFGLSAHPKAIFSITPGDLLKGVRFLDLLFGVCSTENIFICYKSHSSIVMRFCDGADFRKRFARRGTAG